MIVSHLHRKRRLAVLLALLLCSPIFVRGQTKNVVATVNGRNITLDEVDNSVLADLFALQQQIYALRKAALENLVARTILELEAARRNISVAELRKQLTEGKVEVTAAEVEQNYAEHAQVFGTMSPDEAKERLRLDLESSARMQKYRERLAGLRQSAKIELLLEEPRLPAINSLNAPSLGRETARVVIIEFADFECPYCRSSQPVLKELTKKYGDRIRLVFKHRPLEIHSQAFLASQAAFCAAQQGMFWAYHDALFASDELAPANLKTLAVNLHLDENKFNTCLTSEESRLAVQKDLDEARHFGINSTPTFVINGKLFRGAPELDQFTTAIDAELKRVVGPN